MKVLFYSVLIVAIDQFSKLIIKGFSVPFLKINFPGMYQGQRVPVIDDFLRFTYIENPGMAFGVDPGTDLKLYTSLFSLIASIGLIIYIYHIRKESFATRLSLAFILGGAVGNLIDRMFYGLIYGYAPIFHGKVVDFIDFDFFNVTILGRSYDRFPIFNVADSAVTIGVLLLLIFYNKLHREETVVPEQGASDPIPADTSEIPGINPGENETNPGKENINNTTQDDNGEPDNGKKTPL